MAGPTRDQIKPLVVERLARLSGFAADEIKETQHLEIDLGLNEQMRAGLSPSFGSIARKYNSKANVGRTECKQLNSVKAAIDLVFKRST